MSKPVKDLVTKEIAAQYQGVDSACVVDLTGIDGVKTHKLRGSLHGKGIEVHIVKNRLARRAFDGGPLAPLGKYLDGPCAMVTGGQSIVDVAKELVGLMKDFPTIKLKKAIIEGDAGLVDVAEVAKWKGRRELQAEIAMQLCTPGRKIAGCAAGPAGRIAGCLKAIVDKAPPADAPADAPAEAAAADAPTEAAGA